VPRFSISYVENSFLNIDMYSINACPLYVIVITKNKPELFGLIVFIILISSSLVYVVVIFFVRYFVKHQRGFQLIPCVQEIGGVFGLVKVSLYFCNVLFMTRMEQYFFLVYVGEGPVNMVRFEKFSDFF
jgi:hypothetical protein